MACRSGCKTQTCASYGECCRNGAPMVAHLGDQMKASNRELSAYADARRQGIQPAGTRAHMVDAAVRMSDKTGVAWRADK